MPVQQLTESVKLLLQPALGTEKQRYSVSIGEMDLTAVTPR